MERRIFELNGRSGEKYKLFPGIELKVYYVEESEAVHKHKPEKRRFGIYYCRKGRLGWQLKNDMVVYIGPGDIALISMDLCCSSKRSYPLGFYEGITVSIDLDEIQKHPIEILEEAGITPDVLYKKFCEEGKVFEIPATKKFGEIFSEGYEISEHMKLPYYKLRIQELLLKLCIYDYSDNNELSRCQTDQMNTIKEIHEWLTKNLETRNTIEDLAKQYLINSSTLKQVFKAVYGRPIATYMKEYRIKKAKEILCTTNISIAELAQQLGYRSQSRFSEAFKDITGMLPTEYRKKRM